MLRVFALRLPLHSPRFSLALRQMRNEINEMTKTTMPVFIAALLM
jgi:hypothetical protein|nr:MAG TPA: hypothetical protein [Caudoviricetes sp.]